MKKAFTLLELIVVIGIIMVLAGVLLTTFSGTTESARAAKCMSNMRNLAQAWSGGRAGSQEQLMMALDRSGVKKNYSEAKGWISYWTKGLYPSESHQTFDPIGLYEKDDDRAQYAISNGWMCAALGKNPTAMVCPSHAMHAAQQLKKKQVHWSYFMNAAFGWDACRGGYTYVNGAGYIEKSGLTNADRLLIFAEIPFRGPGNWFPDGDDGTEQTDAILQYDGCDQSPTAAGKDRYNGKENIGGNHKLGKYWVAHLAFADGHVEKLRVDGIDPENLKELTTWLCEGKSVGRNGNVYEELK